MSFRDYAEYRTFGFCLYCRGKVLVSKWRPYCSEHCWVMSYDYQPDAHRELEDHQTEASLKELAQYQKDRDEDRIEEKRRLPASEEKKGAA